MKRDLIGIVHARQHIHVDAGFNIGELRLHQGADAYTNTADA